MAFFWDVLYAAGAIAVSSLGGGAVILALSNWFGKVWANKILEADRARYTKEIEELRAKYRHEVEQELELLRDRLQKGQFVHRLQFETEFEVYREIWAKLVEVYNAALDLRPVLDARPNDKTAEEIKKERLDKLNKSFGPFREVVVKNEPFYSPGVFAELDKLSKVVCKESFDYDAGDSGDQEYWRKARDNAALIADHINKICAAIRERIGNIIPVPDRQD